MMEFARFIDLLKKHKFTLLAVPLLVVGITYALVRNIPNVYISKARISSGLADRSQQLLVTQALMQESSTNQAFSNLIQMLQMKKVVDQVSYELILHDLQSKETYRKPSKLFGYLNASARAHAIEVYTHLHDTRQPLSLLDNDQKGLNDVLISMGYDYESLAKKLKVYRVENSDFINVEFEGESAELTYVFVNTLVKEFILYYTFLTKENEMKSIDYLDKLLLAKKDSLNSRIAMLKQFKIANRVLNLNEQAKSMYTIMADFETRIEMAQKDIEANAGALKGIESKFNANDRQYLDSKLTLINQEIVVTKHQLNALNDAYIKSNFDNAIKLKMDSLKEVLSQKINQSTDRYILNPLAAKENLVNEKLKLEISLDLAKHSVQSLQNELDKLNKRFDQLVPNEAVIQAFEGDINVADQEYVEILKKYNESSLELNSSVKLKLLEAAAPGSKQPSKKIILVAVSGIASFVLCLLVLFILFYIDNTLRMPAELAAKTNMPVLGYLPLLDNITSLDLKQLWSNDVLTRESSAFKSQLRSARFEIDAAITSPILTITSLDQNEGKSMLAVCLASAYLMIGKRVLLIDGNFGNPSITQLSDPQYFIEDYLTGAVSLYAFARSNNEVTMLGNKGMDISLFEVSREDTVLQKLEALKEEFDVVIIETPALNALNKSKEWIKVSGNVLAVFESGHAISGADSEYVDYLASGDRKFIGWVMNKVRDEKTPKQKKKRKFSLRKNKTNE